jgi:multiple sugar transport system permease protein
LRLRTIGKKVGRALAAYGVLTAFALVMLGPLLWMALSALKTPMQLFDYPPTWIPNPVIWSNFADAWNAAPFGKFFGNSAKVTALTTAGALLLCSMAGYAFARLNFRGKRVTFALLLSTLMIPYTVRVIPLFVMLRSFGWVNTHYALIVPPVFSNVFGVFLLRQFYMSLPQELDEAALIDGCSYFGIYWRILMPLSKPAVATLGLFTFRTSWNQFLPALVYISSIKKQTITVGLTVFQDEFITDWHLMMAASTLAVLPVLVVYVTAQKYFIRGIVLTGLKG